MSSQPAVVVMARAPRLGHSKTRLQPLLGAAGCARLQRALISHTTTVVAGAGGSQYVAVDPPDALAEVAAIAGAATGVFAQAGQHLGARMCAAVAHVTQLCPGPVVVVGTDVPHLTAGHLRNAARLIQRGHDVVFGPALDGGYYLMALARPIPAVFDIGSAAWGTETVLAVSVAAARSAGLTVGFLTPLRDLDTPADAHALSVDDATPVAIRSILHSPVVPAQLRLPQLSSQSNRSQ